MIKRGLFNISAAVMIILTPNMAFAGGAAVQRNQQPPPEAREQLREQIRQRREQEAAAQRFLQQRRAAPPLEAPPIPVEEKKKIQKKYYAPSKVLTSSPPAPRSAPSPQPRARTNIPSGSNDELAQVLARFDQSSVLWLQINDPRMKVIIVSRYIDLYKQFGIYIRKAPQHYVAIIDSMSRDNPAMLQNPFDQVLRVVSILEYDYEDGQSKDALARSILQNQQAFIANKQRLGLQ